jgi:hypothetical protein
MRRLFLTLSALGLLGAVIGCGHNHGVCDCEPPPEHCPAYCNDHATPIAPIAQSGPVPVLNKTPISTEKLPGPDR